MIPVPCMMLLAESNQEDHLGWGIWGTREKRDV